MNPPRRNHRRTKARRGKQQPPAQAGTARAPAPAPGRGPAEFWGAPPESSSQPPVRPAGDPTAVVRSLGPPPLAGRDTLAEHYFDAVYARAGALAAALAAAAELLDDEPS